MCSMDDDNVLLQLYMPPACALGMQLFGTRMLADVHGTFVRSQTHALINAHAGGGKGLGNNYSAPRAEAGMLEKYGVPFVSKRFSPVRKVFLGVWS